MDILYESTHIFYGFIGITSLIITYATINQHSNSNVSKSPIIQEAEPIKSPIIPEAEPIKSPIIPEAEPIQNVDLLNNDKSGLLGGKHTRCNNKTKKSKIKNKK